MLDHLERSESVVARGFRSEVLDAQRCFRTILNALSQPGSVHLFEVELPQVGLPLGTSAVLLALADYDTPVWYSDDVPEFAKSYVRFHTGALATNDISSAVFACASSLNTLPEIALFPVGTNLSPERAATVIVGVSSFDDGEPVELAGPGNNEPRRVQVAGMDRTRWESLQQNHQRFPCGVDTLFVTDTTLMAIPRSTRITLVPTRTGVC